MHIQPWHFRNSGMFRTQGIFKSLSDTEDDQKYLKSWHSQNSSLKQFQERLGIFRDTDAYSATFTDANYGRVGGGLPCNIFKIEKKALMVSIFGLRFPFKMWF